MDTITSVLISPKFNNPRTTAANPQERMMINKIETHIRSYEINGSEVTGLPRDEDSVIVSAHQIRKDLVVLDWHGRTITVCAEDLRKAITNAINHD